MPTRFGLEIGYTKPGSGPEGRDRPSSGPFWGSAPRPMGLPRLAGVGPPAGTAGPRREGLM